jgi:hypothetical protein
MFVDTAKLVIIQLCNQKLKTDIITNILNYWCLDTYSLDGLKKLISKPIRRELLKVISDKLEYVSLYLLPRLYSNIPSNHGGYHIVIMHNPDKLQLQIVICKKCGSYCSECIYYPVGSNRIYCQCANNSI